MIDPIKPGPTNAHGDYEHQDLLPGGIVYFLLALGIGTGLCMLGIRGLYGFLDRREKASQPGVSPLLTHVPEDTRHVAKDYPQTAFPDPRLEEDERGQLNGIRTAEESALYSYGWVDQQAGTVRIPIDRAMDLLVERGLPVRQGAAEGDKAAASVTDVQTAAAGKGKKK